MEAQIMSGVLRSLSAVRIFVNDLDRARRFYGDIVELRETAAAPEWAVFDIEGKNLIIEKVPLDDPEHDLVGRLLAVSFDVDDIGAVYRDLSAKGVSFPEPPEKQSWGGTLAFPRDPDGNILTLVG
jgi:catechol 2,3-dioxygenase-like lactoylglutathione lyase family enzyme